MTIRFSVTARNAGLNASLDLMDAGAGPGTIKVYTGSQPATVDTAPSGTLLATFTCADPAFVAPVDGARDLDADPDLTTTAVDAGEAGWARCADSDGNPVMDGSVGTATGVLETEPDFIINSAAITTGQTVNLLTGTVTDPA